MPASLSAIDALVRTATGPPGLVVLFAYSFLVAVALPLPGELVLAAPLRLGIDPLTELALIIVVSGAGKALGSLAALRIGQGAASSGPVARATDRLLPEVGVRSSVVAWFRGLVQRHGYLGLAVTLSVPMAPDTASVYAFSVAEVETGPFAAAAFVGSAARLVIVAGLAGAVLAVF